MGQKGNHREVRKYLETNEKENTTFQKICDALKTVLRRKFVAMKCLHLEEERSQIINLISHLEELEKEEKTNPKPAKGTK